MIPEAGEALERAIEVLSSDASDEEAFASALVEIDHVLTLDTSQIFQTILLTLKAAVQAKLSGEDGLAGQALNIAQLLVNATHESNNG